LHGLIRDEHGRKMSKSYGNVIDPLPLMDELGTDALRFTLLVGSTPGNDMNLSIKRVEANRNFANKIWNAGRFVINACSQAQESPASEPQWTLADSWVWAKLQTLVREVERLFQNYQYGEAGRQIYDFFWSEFADWYVEVAKLQLAQGGDRAYYTAYTLVRVLDTCLRLLHPFTPFITEELWGHLSQALLETPLKGVVADWPRALIIARWPEPRPLEGWEEDCVAEFNLLQEIVRSIRNLRSEKNVTPGKSLPAKIVAGDWTEELKQQAATLAALAQLNPQSLQIMESLDEKSAGAVALVVGAVEIYLPLADLVNLDEERSRLTKGLTEAESQITRLEALLSSQFVEKAPPAVVEKEREKLAGFNETAEKLRLQLRSLD
jgi:valyl-tRNA synthetase